MKHGSLFTGIGGFDLGFERAGIETALQVEFDPYCLQLLESKWPDAERRKDVKEIEGPELGSVDVISGGFPCQDVSIAGRREGLDGERSGLWFEFHRILEVAQPQWAVIENVPGLLSSNGGQDFAVILRGLEELGYCVAYRILDAQYFGVPQRRRRVFVVGCLGEWRSVEVLFESESLPGDPPASQKAGEEIAGTISSRLGSGGPDLDSMGAYVTQTLYEFHGQDSRIREHTEVSPTLHKKMGTGGNNTPLVAADPLSNRPYADRGPDNNLVTESSAGDEACNLVAAPLRSRQHPNSNMPGRGGEEDENLVLSATQDYMPSIAGTMTAKWSKGVSGSFAQDMSERLLDKGDGVRRLTPRECERLQGFPDDWTAEFSDSRRYRMIGNAVAVPVAEWLGRRILSASS